MPSRLVTILIAALFVSAGAVGAFLYMSRHSVHANVPPAALAELKTEAPQTVPDVAFSDASGARHTLSSYRGHYVLLNLWATWCAPCVKELPALAKLQGAVPPARLSVVTVNVGRGSAGDTAAFLKDHNATALPVFLDTDTAFIRAFGAFGLPLSILIDPQGREVARAVGPADWDAPDAIAYFKDLTGVHAAS
jgi:thiol-disulfide isomerase/thioredoxin